MNVMFARKPFHIPVACKSIKKIIHTLGKNLMNVMFARKRFHIPVACESIKKLIPLTKPLNAMFATKNFSDQMLL
jgi:hypothetical protein